MSFAVHDTDLLRAEDPVPPVRTAPGLGDPGELQQITVEFGLPSADSFTLAGRDSRQQLVVTGHYSSGQLRDFSRQVAYSAEPADVVTIDSTGLVMPAKEGQATIKIQHASGKTATTRVEVKNLVQDVPVNFANEVVPVFTKYSCNSGGCHGKASGQNGFKLSLLGFEPREDFEHLVKEARGRRIFPAAPERSLLLLKAIGAAPHGGGARIEQGSPGYRVLKRWIDQGMPYGKPEDPTVAKIQVTPASRTLGPQAEQQITVTAHYTDGTTKDVTNLAQFDANDPEMASCTPLGLVKTNDLTGAVAIMARFQGQVAVFRAMIPLGAPVENLPPSKNFIDDLVAAQWKQLGIPPSKICDDNTFIRRVSIDITGRLPSIAETEAFIADADPAKREKLVDRLLASSDYADFFANKWSAVLRNKKRQESQTRGTYLFYAWIRQSLNENKPYDQFVREIIAASGDATDHPPVVWYREVKDSIQQQEDTAQLFLGMRIQCAHCHHHPFEKWSQQDYFSLNAFFSRVGRKPGAVQGEDKIFHQRGLAQSTNTKTGAAVKPAGLDAAPMDLTVEQDPRHALVDWMAAPDNKFFAPALVNRYWKHFFSRGLVDPEDDMRVTNPPSNPELLEALAQHFIKSGFNLKDLIRTICLSNTYQLSSEPNEWNGADKQSFARYYPKRLNAEVLLDSIDTVTASPTKFGGLPEGIRATQLPDTGVNSYFLQVFGKPDGASACECERTNDANLAQSLHLLNSGEIQAKLSNANGRANKLAEDKTLSPEQKLDQLYLAALARKPNSQELSIAKAHLEKIKNDKIAFEDLIWVVLNTKEFLFNH
ncbi:MAG: DUF1549 domain-containing protein [Pirellulales bacterium]|nr:DUF1549 domain-containing protein [Pirellulales bacterium]